MRKERLLALLLSGALMALVVPPAFAENDCDTGDGGEDQVECSQEFPLETGGTGNTGDQGVTVTVPGAPGVLTVSHSQGSVSVGTVEPGETSDPIQVGNIIYSNTQEAGLPWSASVAATALEGDDDDIPFANLEFTPGSTITPGSGAVGNPVPAAGGSFSGSNLLTSFSDPLTISTASGETRGTFTHSGSTLEVSIPEDAAGGDYSGVLQYTVSG